MSVVAIAVQYKKQVHKIQPSPSSRSSQTSVTDSQDAATQLR
ncbi:MAG: hypothetical protein WAM88_06925 [Nitrososphaeraceae archaeon]